MRYFITYFILNLKKEVIQLCRMAFFPSVVEKKHEGLILHLLQHLEAHGGGQGNGVSFADEGGLSIQKGVSLSCEEVVSKCLAGNTVFHSRIASAGGVSEENTQPFRISEKFSLAHNGTWKEYPYWIPFLHAQGYSISLLSSLSDTAILALLIENLGKVNTEFLDLPSTGVFILHGTEETVVHVKTGDFEILNDEALGVIFASEFPFDWYAQTSIKRYVSGTLLSIKGTNVTVLKGGIAKEKETDFSWFKPEKKKKGEGYYNYSSSKYPYYT